MLPDVAQSEVTGKRAELRAIADAYVARGWSCPDCGYAPESGRGVHMDRESREPKRCTRCAVRRGRAWGRMRTAVLESLLSAVTDFVEAMRLREPARDQYVRMASIAQGARRGIDHLHFPRKDVRDALMAQDPGAALKALVVADAKKLPVEESDHAA